MSDKKDILDNINNTILKYSEKIVDFMTNLSMAISSETFITFIEFINELPDDIKDTEFYIKIQKLQNENLDYQDVVWLIESFDKELCNDCAEIILNFDNDDLALHRYIKKIIMSDDMSNREKIIILLAHIEPLIYDSLQYSKKQGERIKRIVPKITLGHKIDMSIGNYCKLFILGVVYVVFSNTDKYTEEIDRRIPFRNNILHNGIVMYSDEDVEELYNILLCFVIILMECKSKIMEKEG